MVELPTHQIKCHIKCLVYDESEKVSIHLTKMGFV